MELEKSSNNKKIFIGGIVIGGAILAMYVGTSIFFINRFNPGSTINCISVSGKTVDEAFNEMVNQSEIYELSIKGRNGFNETIRSSDINLLYDKNETIQQFKDSQNPLGWIKSVFSHNEYTASELVYFDENKLEEIINKFSCFKPDNIEEPKNPILQYENGNYTILKESDGNKAAKDKVTEAIKNAIENGKTFIDIDESGCYEKPRFTSESQEIVEAKNILDKYVSTEINYNIGNEKEVLDGDKIREFLDVDSDYNVTINKDKIKKYVLELAQKYDTVGKTREFVTTGGSNISISGGDYGRKVDVSEETEYIADSIEGGKTESREPKYSQVPFCNEANDIGNTYVEVSLSGQHLWFYKDGAVIAEGPIVSGNISNGNGTPGGVYKLDYKERNATLKGEGYSTPVSFWMPFNGGIGIHDATWRGSFGGNIYVTGGSHGCVNAPYNLANIIFNNIDEGTPIVCYY